MLTLKDLLLLLLLFNTKKAFHNSARLDFNHNLHSAFHGNIQRIYEKEYPKNKILSLIIINSSISAYTVNESKIKVKQGWEKWKLFFLSHIKRIEKQTHRKGVLPGLAFQLKSCSSLVMKWCWLICCQYHKYH